ncbi:MAG: polymer-forming cytoskeletal protein [Xanthobacteraceae bacterium]
MALFAKEAKSHNDRIVASTQEEISRLARDRDPRHPDAASSISAGLSIVGKIVGHGSVTVFGHVDGELRASIVVIAKGAEMAGDVFAEEVTISGHVKGSIHANRVRLGGTGFVEGDIFHRTLAIEENARFEGASRRNENAIDAQSLVQINGSQTRATSIGSNGMGNGASDSLSS